MFSFRNALNVAAIICLSTLMSACADGGSKKGKAGEGSNTGGGDCTAQFITEFNSGAQKCDNMFTTQQKKDCKMAAEAIKAKYPNLNCKAERNGEIVSITIDEVQQVIDQLAAEGI